MTGLNEWGKQGKVIRNPGQRIIKGLTKGLFKGSLLPPDPIKAYGLGAHLPPMENKELDQPVTLEEKNISPEEVVSQFYPERLVKNNCFFEALLMQIIIYWLLKWLFGFDRFNAL